MNAPAKAKLYAPQMLALATQLSSFPLSEDLSLVKEQRSRVCGSSLVLGLKVNGTGQVEACGMQVSACAVGQAACAIMASAAKGKTAEDFISAREQLTDWLDQTGPMPDWPGLEALEPAIAHPSRHGAIVMPWEAAIVALSLADAPS